MCPPKKLSREEKGKDIVVVPNPVRDATTNEPLEDFGLVHREALRDMSGLDLSQRLLVVDAERDLMGEDGGDAVAEMLNDPRLRRSRVARSRTTRRTPVRLGPAESRQEESDVLPRVPTRYLGNGVFERGAEIPQELLRTPDAPGQSWENVWPTRSTAKSVEKLLIDCDAKG
ncbi:hypothetical protein Bca4012_064758 [Brassica carinata]